MNAKTHIAMSALLISLTVLLCAFDAAAAPLTMKVDRQKIAINEAVEVVLQVNARHAILRVPDTDDFDITNATSPFNQPMFCMSMGMEVISGPCTFRFYFAPVKAGDLTIPEFKLVDNFYRPGRLVGQTKAATIAVSKEKVANPRTIPKRQGRRGQRNPHSRRQQMRPQSGPSIAGPDQAAVAPSTLESLDAMARYDLFLVPQAAKDTYLINEPFTVDFVLYVGDDSGASSLQGLELPELDGFRKERLESEDSELGRAVIQGKGYNRYRLSSYVLVPMESGERVVEGAVATVLASSSNIQQFQGGFSISIGRGSQPVEAHAPPLKLTISEPPTPYPLGFSTANIGEFSVENVVLPQPQPAGTWMVLKYDLVGKGNLLSVAVPNLTGRPGLEVRKPHLDNSAVTIDHKGIHGRLGVQLPFRVTRAGALDLPPLTMTYFDPEKGRYDTLKIPVGQVVVERPRDHGDGQVALPEDDLSPLVAEGELLALPEHDPWQRGRIVLWALAVAGLLYLLGWAIRGAQALADRDPERRHRKAALHQARKDLAEAQKQLDARATDAFYAALTRSLSNYIEGRFGLQVGSTTFGVLTDQLLSQGVPEPLAKEVLAELESADYGRFAPSALQDGDMGRSTARIRELMARLDKVKGGPA